jgi:DNA-directed RNA polymerase specialized sigma24 family protein
MPTTSWDGRGFAQLEGDEFPPDVAAEVNDECLRLLGMLDEEQRKIVQRKVEGCSHKEIAQELGCALCTVERKVGIIRRLWRESRDA